MMDGNYVNFCAGLLNFLFWNVKGIMEECHG
jgi:hypothetical protein